jgi:hypothetical protein
MHTSIACPVVHCTKVIAVGKSQLERHLNARHATPFGRRDDYSCPLCGIEIKNATAAQFYVRHFVRQHMPLNYVVSIEKQQQAAQDEEPTCREELGMLRAVEHQSTAAIVDEVDEATESSESSVPHEALHDIDIVTEAAEGGEYRPDTNPVPDLAGVDLPRNLDTPTRVPWTDNRGSTEYRKHRLLLHAMKHKLTEDHYEDLFGMLIVFGVDMTAIPSDLKTMRSQIIKMTLDPIIKYTTPIISDGNRFPVCNPISIARFWNAHPVISKLAAENAEKYCLPYMDSLADLQQRRRDLEAAQLTDGVGPMWTAPMWLDTLIEQEYIWREGYDFAKQLGIRGELAFIRSRGCMSP